MSKKKLEELTIRMVKLKKELKEVRLERKKLMEESYEQD